MLIRAEQLELHLNKGSLVPLYTIHGDEPLLALEAADAIRAAARKQGFAEREVLTVERSFDWSAFAHAGASRSIAACNSAAVSTGSTATPGGTGSATVDTSVTCAPRAAASAAIAYPCLPDDRLAITRTASIGSRVPPADTATFNPFRSPGESTRSTAARVTGRSPFPKFTMAVSSG